VTAKTDHRTNPPVTESADRPKQHSGRRTLFVLTVLFTSVSQGLLAIIISLSAVAALPSFLVATVLATCGVALVFAAGLQDG